MRRLREPVWAALQPSARGAPTRVYGGAGLLICSEGALQRLVLPVGWDGVLRRSPAQVSGARRLSVRETGSC